MFWKEVESGKSRFVCNVGLFRNDSVYKVLTTSAQLSFTCGFVMTVDKLQLQEKQCCFMRIPPQSKRLERLPGVSGLSLTILLEINICKIGPKFWSQVGRLEGQPIPWNDILCHLLFGCLGGRRIYITSHEHQGRGPSGCLFCEICLLQFCLQTAAVYYESALWDWRFRKDMDMFVACTTGFPEVRQFEAGGTSASASFRLWGNKWQPSEQISIQVPSGRCVWWGLGRTGLWRHAEVRFCDQRAKRAEMTFGSMLRSLTLTWQERCGVQCSWIFSWKERYGTWVKFRSWKQRYDQTSETTAGEIVTDRKG